MVEVFFFHTVSDFEIENRTLTRMNLKNFEFGKKYFSLLCDSFCFDFLSPSICLVFSKARLYDKLQSQHNNFK